MSNSRRRGVSIVIPAYNEEKRLPHTLGEIDGFRAGFDGEFEVIVVDDGSLDGTVDLVNHMSDTLPWLRLLERPHLGKGAAVRAGMLAARLPHVILCDADLSMPAAQIDRFIAELDHGEQIAIGSRVLPQSRRYHSPLKRRAMSITFNLLVRTLVVQGVRDTQCGFKGFQREVAQDLFARQRLNGFSFDVEILYLARRSGYRVLEVPIDWYFDADSRVRAGVDVFKMLIDLFRIRARALTGGYRRPASLAVGGRMLPSSPPGRLQSAVRFLVGITRVLTSVSLWFGLLVLVLFGLFTAPIVMASGFLAVFILVRYVQRLEA